MTTFVFAETGRRERESKNPVRPSFYNRSSSFFGRYPLQVDSARHCFNLQYRPYPPLPPSVANSRASPKDNDLCNGRSTERASDPHLGHSIDDAVTLFRQTPSYSEHALQGEREGERLVLLLRREFDHTHRRVLPGETLALPPVGKARGGEKIWQIVRRHCTLDVCASEICNSNPLAGAGVNISSSKRWEEFRTFDNVLPVVVMAIISARKCPHSARITDRSEGCNSEI